MHQHLHTENEMLQIEENANVMATRQDFCIYFNKVKKPQKTFFEKNFYPIKPMGFATFLLVLQQPRQADSIFPDRQT